MSLIDEETQPEPVSVYGKSKLKGEDWVTSILSDAYIIRTSWVYSSFGKNFVKTMINLSRQQDEIKVVADQIGEPVALDFLDLVLRQDVLVPVAVRGAEVPDLLVDDGRDQGAGVTPRKEVPLADAAREQVHLVREMQMVHADT